MTTYQGAATLWLSDSRQFAATADLRKDQAGTWSGTLTFAGDDHVPVLLNVREGTLHVGGRYGEFIRPDTSDWTRFDGRPFVMRIEGNGDAPF